jgi:hypothetical protein
MHRDVQSSRRLVRLRLGLRFIGKLHGAWDGMATGILLGLVDLCIAYRIVAYCTSILSEASPQQQHISCIPDLQIHNICLSIYYSKSRIIDEENTPRLNRNMIESLIITNVVGRTDFPQTGGP